MKAVVTEDGQIAIPEALQRELGWRPGMAIEFSAQDGKLIVSPTGGHQDAFEKWRGSVKLPDGMTVDQYLEMTRGVDRR